MHMVQNELYSVLATRLSFNVCTTVGENHDIDTVNIFFFFLKRRFVGQPQHITAQTK